MVLFPHRIKNRMVQLERLIQFIGQVEARKLLEDLAPVLVELHPTQKNVIEMILRPDEIIVIINRISQSLADQLLFLWHRLASQHEETVFGPADRIEYLHAAVF